MEGILILFIAGIFALFFGVAKKSTLVFCSALAGLIGAALTQCYDITFLSEKYRLLEYSKEGQGFYYLSLLLCGLVVVSAQSSFNKDASTKGDLTGLLLFSLTGGLILIGFKDLFMFFLGLEILSIPLYVMAGSNRKSAQSSEAALKYFYLGSFATAIFLFGVALIYGTMGRFELDHIALIIERYHSELPSMFYVGVLFVLVAMLFKVGAFPFHFWVADVYQGTPSIFMSYMSSVVKLVGIYAFYRLFSGIFVHMDDFWSTLLVLSIGVSMFAGNLSALVQTKFKRLMAYSSISNGAYALMAVLAMQQADGLLIYMIGYGVSVVILMTINEAINDDEDELSKWNGAGKNVLMGIAGTLALLSVAGIPPLTGFFGKFMLFSDAFAEHKWLVFLAILNSVIGAFIYLRIILGLLGFQTTSEGQAVALPISKQVVLVASSLVLLFGWISLYWM